MQPASRRSLGRGGWLLLCVVTAVVAYCGRAGAAPLGEVAVTRATLTVYKTAATIDRFRLRGTFRPEPGADAVDPAAEGVAVRVGTFVQELRNPRVDARRQMWIFTGGSPGIDELRIARRRNGLWSFRLRADRVSLAGTTNPVRFDFRIGSRRAGLNILMKVRSRPHATRYRLRGVVPDTQCGDGVVDEVAEDCDPPGSPCGLGGVCDDDCTCLVETECGNGVVEEGEACDPGPDVPGDCCSADCRLVGAGTVCREAGGACDVAERCTGAAPACPPDEKRTDVCRPATGPCDGAERCDGASNDCPPDGHADDGSPCDDLDQCTAPDACRDGRCIGTPAACGDGIPQVACGEQCDDGPDNSDVAVDACRRDCTRPRCGDGVRDTDEACDDGNASPGDGCRPGCTREVCGDGITDAGESCDDGNTEGGDGCSPGCVLETCGNGRVDAGEACDDGSANSDVVPGACRESCTAARCGDRVVDAGEACDDGNGIAGDGCRPNCTAERCGDGLRDPFEGCDDGNRDGGDGCGPTCVGERCGDGAVDPGEQCDAGEGNSDTTPDACRTTCVAARCGDGVRDAGEGCDDGNRLAGDGCRPDCTVERCGDGVLDAGEGCDDGNAGALDACDGECRLASCGNGVLDAGEACDDGPVGNSDVEPDACRATCTRPRCGDGVTDANEPCDDGNALAGDGCRPGCDEERCGDGVKDVGETCDDGNDAAGDGCAPDCTSELCGNGVRDPAEECDAGVANSDTLPDACRPTCQRARCGDGVVDTGERCDDGNRRDGDRCAARCDDADADGDGFFVVRDDDCDDADLDVYPGAQEQCGDGVDQDCSGDDLSCDQLSIRVTEPRRRAILGAQPITVRGTISDPTAQAEVDDVAADVTGTTWSAEPVPLFEGPNSLFVRARNTAGEEAAVSVDVTLDTTPPVITLVSPVDRALLDTGRARLVFTVEDATPVTCVVDDAPAAGDGAGFAADITLVAGENARLIACTDAAGNRGVRPVVLYRDDAPLVVTDVSPASGATGVDPGTSLRVEFSKQVEARSVGATTLHLSAGATVVPAGVSAAADGLAAVVTPRLPLPAGQRVVVTVTRGVRSSAGVPLAREFRSAFTVAGEGEVPAIAIGEVYDDTRSLPLADVTVVAIAPATGEVLAAAQTDPRGRWVLAADRTPFVVRATKPGFTTVDRLVPEPMGDFVEVLDLRLTPLGPQTPVQALFGRDVRSATGDVLAVAPGSLPADAPVRLTAVSGQGPRVIFPAGWAPLAVVDVETASPFDPPAVLQLHDRTGEAAGRDALLARYDDPQGAWVAVAAVGVGENGAALVPDVTGPGQIALLLPDGGAEELDAVVLGSPLPAAGAIEIPDAVSATGEVLPAVGRADDPTPARATVRITAESPLRSGTPLRGDFMEMFLLRGGDTATPLDTSQDLVAYRAPADATGGTLAADFAIAPSRTFSVVELEQGTITVTLGRGAAIDRTLVGTDGGGVESADGSRLVVPPGVLPGTTAVRLARLGEGGFPVATPAGLVFLGGLEVDVGTVEADEPLGLVLGGAAPGVPSGTTVVVAEVTSIAGRDALVPVAIGRLDGDDIVADPLAAGAPLPGVRRSGRYAFYVVDGTVVGVAGSAVDAAGVREGHLVTVEGLPFACATDAAGAFALVARVGAFAVVATAGTTGDSARVVGHTGTPLPEIVIGAMPPHVEEITVRLPPLEGEYAGPVVLAGIPAPVVIDDGTLGSRGNGNGVIDAGERIALVVAVRNDGTVATPNGTVGLEVRAAAPLAVTPVEAPLAALPPATPTEAGPFVFDVPAGIDPANLVFAVAYRVDGNLSNRTFFTVPLDVEHPNVSVRSEITVRFSRPVVLPAGGGIRIDRIAADGTATPVDARALATPDGTRAIVRPLAVLRDNARFRVTVPGSIADRNGRPLEPAPVVQHFRTEDRTPPVPPAPGQIEVSAPGADGRVRVTGSPGSVNPDDTVIVLNEDTGVSVLATVAADGSFVAYIAAEPGERITIIVRDRNGNEVRLDAGPLVRRDPTTGEIVSVIIGAAGGSVPGADGLVLTVPAGALDSGVEIQVVPVEEPFALPADLASDPEVAAEFDSRFAVAARAEIVADTEGFEEPVALSLPAPDGATEDDLFLVVRTRSVTVGGPLADLDFTTGLTAEENPAAAVERLEVVDSASVKTTGGVRTLSTDSPPFRGIREPGVYTFLRVLEPLTFFAGSVMRDAEPLDGGVVTGLDVDGVAQPFVAVADEAGSFVVPDYAAGGPYPDGSTVAGRLDVRDPALARVTRQTVQGVVAPAPPNVVVAYLEEAASVPAVLPPEFAGKLGDIEPPTVTITFAGPSLEDAFTRVGDPLTVTVTAQDNGVVETVGLTMDDGQQVRTVALAADGTFEITPEADATLTFRATARDAAGNEGTGEGVVRAVEAAPGEPLVPGPAPGPPRLVDSVRNEASMGGFTIVFSEPVDPASITGEATEGFRARAATAATPMTGAITATGPRGTMIDGTYRVEGEGNVVHFTPSRLLKLGAEYRVSVKGLKDPSGEANPKEKVLAFTVPQPVQRATIGALPVPAIDTFADEVAEDVAVVGDHIAVVTHPSTSGEGDKGQLRLYRVRDAADPSKLLADPVPQVNATRVPVNGRPLSIAYQQYEEVVPGDATPKTRDLVFVANRFLGIIASSQFGVPTVASNLQVFDVSDPTMPRLFRQKGLSRKRLLGIDLPLGRWDPNAWPKRVEVVGDNAVVLNFLQNVERFTATPDLGFVDRVGEIATADRVPELGRCQREPKDGTEDVADPPGSGRPCVGSGDCPFGKGEECKPTIDFLDVAAFDHVIAALEQGPTTSATNVIRLIPTAGLSTGFNEKGKVFKLGEAAFGGRLAAAPHFQWQEADGLRTEDLLFVLTRGSGLRILDVSDPANAHQISQAANDAEPRLPRSNGSISVDTCQGLAYVAGSGGDFHVVDFNDPKSPRELNDPGDGAGKKPFAVTGTGGTTFSGIANDRNAVYVVGNKGVAVAEIGGCTPVSASGTGAIAVPRGQFEGACRQEISLAPLPCRCLRGGIAAAFELADVVEVVDQASDGDHSWTLGGARLRLTPPPSSVPVAGYEWGGGGTFYADASTVNPLKDDLRVLPDPRSVYWEAPPTTGADATVVLRVSLASGDRCEFRRQFKTRLLKPGNPVLTGPDVRMLQTSLRLIGLSHLERTTNKPAFGISGTPVAIDGSFGPGTQLAAKYLRVVDSISELTGTCSNQADCSQAGCVQDEGALAGVSAMIDDPLLRALQEHMRDYRAAINAYYPAAPVMTLENDTGGVWVAGAAMKLAEAYRDAPEDPVNWNRGSSLPLMRAWVEQESRTHWGVQGVPFRINVGGADRCPKGSIGFPQILNSHKYGRRAKPALAGSSNGITSPPVNLYDPSEAIRAFAVWAIDAALGADGGFWRSFPGGEFYYDDKLAPAERPRLVTPDMAYAETEGDVIAKGLSIYNSGPNYDDYEKPWPVLLGGVAVGRTTYWASQAVPYALQVKCRAGFAPSRWAWEDSRSEGTATCSYQFPWGEGDLWSGDSRCRGGLRRDLATESACQCLAHCAVTIPAVLSREACCLQWRRSRTGRPCSPGTSGCEQIDVCRAAQCG